MTAAVEDGRRRCPWALAAPAGDQQLLRDYHDHEWGRPVRGRTALFERLTLEGFQSGLSWLVILRKRENFRRAFAGFDIEAVAGFTGADIDRLMADPGIVRNRAKIEAAITNARVAAGLDVDLSELLWAYAPPVRSRPATQSAMPTRTAESTALAGELRSRGFRFVGPTTVYALMQATGMVDDHLQDCWVSGYLATGNAGREEWITLESEQPSPDRCRRPCLNLEGALDGGDEAPDRGRSAGSDQGGARHRDAGTARRRWTTRRRADPR